jgi:hypothetical protein
MPTGRVIHRWDQPAGINFGSFDPYTVYVLEGSRQWHVLKDGTTGRRYQVLIARSEPEAPGYGHGFEYEFNVLDSDTIEGHLRKTEAEWTPAGITLTEPTGHKLFVPKDAFIGGR